MKYYSKIIILIFIAILFSCNAKALESVTIRVNNYHLLCLESNRNYYIDSHNNLIIPMSMALEMFGGKYIAFDKTTNQHIFNFLDKEFRLSVGDNKYYIDEIPHTMESSPIIQDNVLEIMFVPIRIFIDCLDLQTEWNHQWKELSIVDERLPICRVLGLEPELSYNSIRDPDYTVRLVSYSLMDKDNYEYISLTFENISGVDFSEANKHLFYWIGSGFSHRYSLDISKLKRGQRSNLKIEPQLNKHSRNYIAILTSFEIEK